MVFVKISPEVIFMMKLKTGEILKVIPTFQFRKLLSSRSPVWEPRD
jgi:hypothetical protein